MNKTKKRVIATLCVLCFIVISSISVFAASPVYCTGGGGTYTRTHSYGILWLNSHNYSSYEHNVDRVFNGVVYGVSGHNSYSCGESDWYDYCAPGTIVGYAP